MILIDANLLLYAYDSSSTNHESARRWLEGVFAGDEPVRLAWATVLVFLRISTNPRLQQQVFTLPESYQKPKRADLSSWMPIWRRLQLSMEPLCIATIATSAGFPG